MLVNNIGNGAEQIDGAQYLEHRFRVVLHCRELGFGQLAGPIEYVSWDEDLAEVMHQCRQADYGDPGLSQAHLPAYGAGQLPDACLVTSRGRILLLHDRLYSFD